MTIDELKEKLPAELQPWVTEYGPALLAMGAEEVKKWIETILVGRIEEAYVAVLANMDNAKLIEEWNDVNADWQTANVRNAERVSLQQNALAVLLKILMAIALAGVGL